MPLHGDDRGVRVREMFDRIVPRYDLLNRLMTAGMDGRWRRLAAAAALPQDGLALDLATGTGDLAIELLKLAPRRVVGADFSAPMLGVARAKLGARFRTPVEWVLADATALPFRDATFDCVTSGFLLRNVADLARALVEMHRVLKPGGRAVSLELTRMRPGMLSSAFGVYFRHVLPTVGGWISGQPVAYHYLPASVGMFPDAERLAAMFREAGFASVSYRRLAFGSVAIHVARRS